MAGTDAMMETFRSHMERAVFRVRDLMLATSKFHSIEEIKARLGKVHGLRFPKSEVVAALGKLRAAGYLLEKQDRKPSGPNVAAVPEYRLRDRAAEQLKLISEPGSERQPGDEAEAQK